MNRHTGAAVTRVGGGGHARGERARIAGHGEGVDKHQNKSQPGREAGGEADGERHGGGEQHHQGDGAVAAELKGEFVAEDAGRHGEHGDERAHRDGAERRAAAARATKPQKATSQVRRP